MSFLKFVASRKPISSWVSPTISMQSTLTFWVCFFFFSKFIGVAKSTLTVEKVLWQMAPTLPALCPPDPPCQGGWHRSQPGHTCPAITAGKVSGALCPKQLRHSATL